jgi:hypothetical protein
MFWLGYSCGVLSALAVVNIFITCLEIYKNWKKFPLMDNVIREHAERLIKEANP